MNNVKKYLIGFLTSAAIAMLCFPLIANASLYQYYKEQGESMPSFKARAELAAEKGIFGYRGTATQNKLLEERLRESDGLVGFSVSTRYKTTLQSSMTSSQTTIPVSSILSYDGTTLTMALLGPRVYLTVEPGSSREEILVCTTITSSQFSGCTRGLAFTGTSIAGVAANQKAHRAGSVVIMSDTHYVFEELVDKDSSEAVAGIKNFSSSTIRIGDNTTTENKIVYAYNGSASNPFFRYNESLGRWQFSDNGVDTTNFTTSSAAGLSASSTAGIGITDSFIYVLASSTKGMAFGSDGRLYQMTSSTGGINSDSNGLSVDATDNFAWTGTETHSGANTFNTATTTFNAPAVFTTTTVSTSTVTALTLGGQNANTLINGSNADALHTHSFSAKLTATTTNSGGTVTSGAETTLSTYTLPANTVGTGNVVTMRIYIDWTGATNVGNAIFRCKYGSTTIISKTVTMDNNTNGYSGYIEFILMGAGTTSSQEGKILTAYSNSSASAVGGTGVMSGGSGNATEDSTTALAMAITAQMASGNDQTMTITGSHVDIIR